MTVRQLGYVTDDLEGAAMAWVTKLGAGPFFLMPGMTFQSWSYLGAPQDMRLDIAFGQAGDLMVELIRPDGAWPNVYGDAPPKGTRLHHHGYLVADMETAARAMGREPTTQARLSDSTELRYFDARDSIGHVIELITDSEESRGFFDLAAQAARDWDCRSDPLRAFGSGS